MTVKFVVLLLSVLLLLGGCAKPPEQAYHHPQSGTVKLTEHIDECGKLSQQFGYINMSPVHQYPMEDMKDVFQRGKVFRYCMAKKGYVQHDSDSVIIDSTNTIIEISDTVLAAGETSIITIAFSSAVGGLEAEDLSVANGNLSNIKTVDRGLTWTAIFTPFPDLEDTNNIIALNNSGVINAVSNPGIGITYSSKFRIDTLRPSVEINIRALSLTEGINRSVVNFAFSEPPLDFVESDIYASNGTIDSLERDDSTHFHAIFTAHDNYEGIGFVTINETKFTDVARNNNIAAKPDFVSINTLSPTIAAYLPK